MNNCEAGCNHFSCGSIGHIRECINYPDSMQNMIDNKNLEITLLKNLVIEEILKKICNKDDAIKDAEKKFKFINDFIKKQQNSFLINNLKIK